jgi:hypothetical protein
MKDFSRQCQTTKRLSPTAFVFNQSPSGFISF